MTEAYGAIRRKPFDKLKIEREERSKATPLEPAKSRPGGEMMPRWWIRVLPKPVLRRSLGQRLILLS